MFLKDKRIYSVNSLKGFLNVYNSSFGRYLTLNNKFIGVHKHHRGINNTYFYDLTKKIKDTHVNIKKILIFGLGSGTLQNIFYKQFPGTNIYTVESDPTVIDVFHYFFDSKDSLKQRIINSDPFQFVKNYELVFDFHNQFDLVIVDFNILGSEFYSEVFLSELKNFLKTKGIFVVVLPRVSILQDQENHKFVEKLSLYYNHLEIMYSRSNILQVFCFEKEIK